MSNFPPLPPPASQVTFRASATSLTSTRRSTWCRRTSQVRAKTSALRNNGATFHSQWGNMACSGAVRSRHPQAHQTKFRKGFFLLSHPPHIASRARRQYSSLSTTFFRLQVTPIHISPPPWRPPSHACSRTNHPNLRRARRRGRFPVHYVQRREHVWQRAVGQGVINLLQHFSVNHAMQGVASPLHQRAPHFVITKS